MYKLSHLRIALLAVFCLPALLAGQSRTVNPDSALQKILAEMNGTKLTLAEAQKAGQENSPAVRQAEALYQAASGAVRREKGYFDPAFFFNINYEDTHAPTASFFSGAPILFTKQTTSQTGLQMHLPTGTQLQASLNVVKLQTNSAFAFLNPQYTTFGNLSLRQPLLGGLWVSARKELTRTEHEKDAAKARYQQEVLAINTEVERAYWDLYAAERNYAVRKLLKQQGEAFVHDTKLRADAGIIGPNQLANAQTFLAEQNLLLINEQESLATLSDRLYVLAGIRPQNNSTRFIAVDEPGGDFPVLPLDELLESAVKNNSDLQAAKADIAARQASAKAAGWEALPSVDIVGSLGGNGLAGMAHDVIFSGDTLRTSRAGDLNDAINQSLKRDFKNWTVGVEVNVPIGFRSGRGERQRLQAEVVIAEQNYIEQIRNLEQAINAVHRELANSKQRIEAASAEVAAAQEQVQIGLVEFHNGRSTAFELVRLSADFALAQQRYSEALVKTAKAAVTLRELTSGEYSWN
ncbi:TolC family protein [candidate division KSB1 bacterium]|nr:TolC family protein [candidate division KSB1 bacterium]